MFCYAGIGRSNLRQTTVIPYLSLATQLPGPFSAQDACCLGAHAGLDLVTGLNPKP